MRRLHRAGDLSLLASHKGHADIAARNRERPRSIHGNPIDSHARKSPRRARRDRSLLGCTRGHGRGDKLAAPLALVDIYEAKRWPIEVDETFDPIDVLR